MQAGESIQEGSVCAAEGHEAFVARREMPGLAFDLANLTRNLVKGLFDTYRPELHYMRGAGPK